MKPRPRNIEHINFPLKKDKVIECILHLTTKGLELTSYRVVKLLYLADREHLREFGRPISFDRYVAMENGPVASYAYDVMKGLKRSGTNVEDLPFSVVKIGGRKYAQDPKRAINRKLFSRSDLQILDETCHKYGGWTFSQLYHETHKHEAYDKAWKNRSSNADAMRFEDFFEGMENQDKLIESVKLESGHYR